MTNGWQTASERFLAVLTHTRSVRFRVKGHNYCFGCEHGEFLNFFSFLGPFSLNIFSREPLLGEVGCDAEQEINKVYRLIRLYKKIGAGRLMTTKYVCGQSRTMKLGMSLLF